MRMGKRRKSRGLAPCSSSEVSTTYDEGGRPPSGGEILSPRATSERRWAAPRPKRRGATCSSATPPCWRRCWCWGWRGWWSSLSSQSSLLDSSYTHTCSVCVYEEGAPQDQAEEPPQGGAGDACLVLAGVEEQAEQLLSLLRGILPADVCGEGGNNRVQGFAP